MLLHILQIFGGLLLLGLGLCAASTCGQGEPRSPAHASAPAPSAEPRLPDDLEGWHRVGFRWIRHGEAVEWTYAKDGLPPLEARWIRSGGVPAESLPAAAPGELRTCLGEGTSAGVLLVRGGDGDGRQALLASARMSP